MGSCPPCLEQVIHALHGNTAPGAGGDQLGPEVSAAPVGPPSPRALPAAELQARQRAAAAQAAEVRQKMQAAPPPARARPPAAPRFGTPESSTIPGLLQDHIIARSPSWDQGYQLFQTRWDKINNVHRIATVPWPQEGPDQTDGRPPPENSAEWQVVCAANSRRYTVHLRCRPESIPVGPKGQTAFDKFANDFSCTCAGNRSGAGPTCRHITAVMCTLCPKLGGDPSCRDNEGRSCLHLAANNDSASAARILIQHKVRWFLSTLIWEEKQAVKWKFRVNSANLAVTFYSFP